jgi:hypothetical protein
MQSPKCSGARKDFLCSSFSKSLFCDFTAFTAVAQADDETLTVYEPDNRAASNAKIICYACTNMAALIALK